MGLVNGTAKGVLPEIAKRITSIASDIVTVRLGTIYTDGAEQSSTQVVLDNDPNRVPINALGLNASLGKGTRVACLAYPPRGLLVLGALTGSGGGVPIGSITMWANATPPDGWLICDGSAIDSQYADLIALVGASVPDLRDRAAFGASGTKALLSTGGSTALPQHLHAVSITSGTVSANHTHAMSTLLKSNNAGGVSGDNGSDAVVQGSTGGRFNASQSGATSTISANHTHLVSGNTANAGTGGVTTTQNPYVALHYIIRAA